MYVYIYLHLYKLLDNQQIIKVKRKIKLTSTSKIFLNARETH